LVQFLAERTQVTAELMAWLSSVIICLSVCPSVNECTLANGYVLG